MSHHTIRTQVRQAMDFRQAVRVYNDQEIPKEDMELILDAAWLSPSSVGLEGWRFLVLDRQAIQALRDRLKSLAWGAQYQLDTASHFVILLAEKNARYDSPAILDSLKRRGLTSEEDLAARLTTYQSFQKGDMDIADNPRALFDWTAKQTYIALANMMSTAALIGIDSCPIEGFDYEQANTYLTELKLIDPSQEGISCMLSLGYRLQDPKHPRRRKEREQVIHWVSLD